MYNTNLSIDYISIEGDEGDTAYRKQLLEFFNLKMYNDEVCRHTDDLYELYKDKPAIKKIMPWIKLYIEQKIPLEISDHSRFLFLFSFDFFYLMYPIVCSFIKETEPTEQDINRLLETIQSKIN